jgi:hypothetical protein
MQWKVIPSYPAYEVSEYGDVRRADTGRVRKSSKNVGGYNCFGLCWDGRQKTVPASHLVIEAFIGPKPFPGAYCCHNDGDQNNDHYSNLRWDTAKANADDRIKHGTLYGVQLAPVGEKNGQSKLKTADIIEIRRLKAAGIKQTKISSRFNVGMSVISDILRGKLWTHVS